MAWYWPWSRKRESSFRQPKAAVRIGGSSGSDLDDGFIAINGGRYRSESSAVPAAYAAVNLLTDQLSILPRYVVDSRGVRMAHPINGILKMPSRIVNPIQFWRMMIRQYISHGNAYAWIRRHYVTKQPIELVPAICQRTTLKDSRRAPYHEYTIQVLGSSGSGLSDNVPYSFGETLTVRSSDIIALHGPGYNGIRSPSPILYAAHNIVQTMQEISTHHKNIFERGVNAGMALTINKDVSQNYSIAEYKEIRDAVVEQYSGAENSGKTPFLPPGVEITSAQTLSAQDLQLIELLKWGVEDIARVFGISPIRIGHYHQGMRARTFEAQAVDFERYSIVPHTRTIDSELTMKLLGTQEIVRNHSVSTETDELARGSMTERITAAELASARGGFWTINEAREATGKMPIDGGDRLLDPKGAPKQGGMGE